MALSQLFDSLRAKKATAARSAFGIYIALVRDLASGKEADAGEVGHIIEAAGKTEDHLERDVQLQSQRFAWGAQLQRNQQAEVDRRQAERELQVAQARLQAAVDKLRPAVDQAFDTLNEANLRHLTTYGAEELLCGNLLNNELLQREASLIVELRDVSDELRPLIQDRVHKRSSLMNAELRHSQLTSRPHDAWPSFGTINPLFWRTRELSPAEKRVADLQNQITQLDAAIGPRQREQSRLQGELSAIYAEKLVP